MNIGLIFAGGAGKRMHSKDRPKQFLELYNKPIIIHTLECFENAPEMDAVVIACIEEWIPYLEKLLYKCRIEKVRKVVPGGATGQLSIYNGLKAAQEVVLEAAQEVAQKTGIKKYSGCFDDGQPLADYGNRAATGIPGRKNSDEGRTVVLIHDGVRPFITPKLLAENIQSVKAFGSCITAGIVTETIVVVDDEMGIRQVPSRAQSRVAKAPQSFWLDEILSVHEQALAAGDVDNIDSCTMMMRYGKQLHMIDGPYENIKITTPNDYYTARAILEARENRQIYEAE